MRLDSTLGADVLLLEGFECIEAVSSPYEMTLELLSLDASIDLPKLLRKPVSVSVELAAGGQRIFHGLFRRIVQLGRSEGLVSYRAEVVPSLWFLSLGTDCRIFQQKNVPDIVKEVLTDAGVTDVRNSLTGTYPVRDYCVQYRESHLDFISRLMEEEGIFYFFEHTKEKHTLVLADASSAVKPSQTASLRVHSGAVGASTPTDVITELTVDTEVRSTGAVTLMDYNEQTAKRLESTVKGKNVAGATQLSQFDYPGKFTAKPDGERLARVRIEEAESLAYVVDGKTTCRAIRSGQKLDVTDHYRRDVNASYHVLSARHEANEGSYRSAESVPFKFETSFQAMPHAVPYRPRRVTPKSIVHGSQTAVVVGPSGEEIYVDKYGRVKVQFYWDHLGKNDDKSSCWVRVSSTWAGKQWGFIQIPRVGQEVIVDFLEGDPDRPVIVGRVYNGEQMPPYDLPANHTQSGIKTRSSANGAAADANEIRFEDKKGSEQLLVHAQKDYLIEVENDQTIGVMHDRKLTVDNDETIVIKGKRTETVQKDESITYAEGNQDVKLDKGDQTITVAKGKQTISVEDNRSITVKSGNLETTVQKGNVTVKTSAGAITYDAAKGIELKVGGNSIKVAPDGITIKGLKIGLEGSVQTEIKSVMTTVKGDGMLTLKGGVTMIN
jgi:type VI secretion system secreted protein VgrG